ncbi:MAG TPA: hypothetical protein VGR19_02545 [Allosphingosinicella sp.]|nr:hypothetical protein [Allosphingosinicella sp.]
MAQQQDEKIEQPKREWVKPEVLALEAGSAEAGGGAVPDGNVQMS